jgi:two-component system chemotaxis response regulator CheB
MRSVENKEDMPGHDIIVIGTSAGGLEPLITITRELPKALAAAVFIVQHTPAVGPSLLPAILANASPLTITHAVDGAPIEHGHVYVAPPDHHMLIKHDHIHIVRGPKENGFRPAIDATFRTAAQSYGPRVVGVILTGMLDDGTAGLLAIKHRGGIAIVQDPREAPYPSMPESACRYVSIDAVVRVQEIPPLLVTLTKKPAEHEGDVPMSDQMDLEANISTMDRDALAQSNTVGTPSVFSCPDCGGVLAEYYDGDLLRFRCQVGHAFSPESFFASQTEVGNHALWSAYRALHERASLAKRLAEDARRHFDNIGQRRFLQLFKDAEQRKEQIWQALQKDESSEVQERSV